MQKFDKESEVYKMIQENKESRTAPRQSNTFRMLQEVLEADEKGPQRAPSVVFNRCVLGPLAPHHGKPLHTVHVKNVEKGCSQHC